MKQSFKPNVQLNKAMRTNNKNLCMHHSLGDMGDMGFLGTFEFIWASNLIQNTALEIQKNDNLDRIFEELL